MLNHRFKLIIGGLFLIANLFLSTYYTNVDDVLCVNHVYDTEPYSLKSYWYQLHLHFTGFVYVLVFAVIGGDWGFIKYVYGLLTLWVFVDFYLGYNDFTLDADAVNMVMIPLIIIYVALKKEA